jgi:hypothetical protein
MSADKPRLCFDPSRIENGTGKPDADNIARLAAWLDMPIETRDASWRRATSDPKPVV